MAVGYDDKMSIKNELCDKETKGALLIGNRGAWNGVKRVMDICLMTLS
jgi:C1A family cysteine protease